jgi:hypothetical protein
MSQVSVAAETRAGVGHSAKADDREAGVEAARAALEQAGVERCDLVLLFVTGKGDPAAVEAGVRSVVGPHPKIVGGATVGVITRECLGFEGHQVGVAVLTSPRIQVQAFSEGNISDRELEAGRSLGTKIRAAFPEAQPTGLLLLVDIVKTEIGGSTNLLTPLLSGLTQTLGDWPPTAGGALMGNLMFSRSFQWNGDTLTDKSAVALTLSGNARLDSVTLHGCRPSGRYFTVTKADGSMVLELDGRPATEVVAQILGAGGEKTNWEAFPLFVTLGINHGDPFGEYREENYAVRMCSAVDKDRGGLAFFADDLQPGVKVQFLRRSIDMQYMADRVNELKARVAGRRPILALYIDCAGRCSAMCGSDGEEATEIQRMIGGEMPLLGWYVGGEIARAGAVMQSHNWTGILSIISEDAAPV